MENGATNNTFINCSMSCPKCKSRAYIPDGKYSALGENIFAVLHDISDVSLKNLLKLLKKVSIQMNYQKKSKKKCKPMFLN